MPCIWFNYRKTVILKDRAVLTMASCRPVPGPVFQFVSVHYVVCQGREGGREGGVLYCWRWLIVLANVSMVR